MASVRFTALQSRPMEFLDFTSVTLDEFQQLVPPFEAAFQAHMAAWRMDGKPRTARRFTVYKNCPLPTPEDRLLFVLTSLKTYTLQVVQGRLFGMVQGKTNQWIHVLLPVLLAALRALGDAPTRRRIPCPGEPPLTGSGLPGVYAAPGRDPHADQETPRPGADAGARAGQPGPAPPSAADRACQQQRQALPRRQRPDPAVEGGRSGSRDGTLLCPA